MKSTDTKPSRGPADKCAFTAIKALSALSVFGLLLGLQPLSAAKKADAPDTEPNYTKGGKPHRTDIEWTLGPTGAYGYMWGEMGDDATKNTRMIYVTSVREDSPADGVLEAGDVILGVVSPHPDGPAKANARFTRDVRHVLGAAITEAEKSANRGELTLNIWRKDKTMPATLKLDVKGSFSVTTPYECEKTKQLIDEAAQAIMKRGLMKTNRAGTQVTGPKGGVSDFTDALGLLATGEVKYRPQLQEYARALAKQNEDLDIYAAGEETNIGTWYAAYRNLFLTEYYLATKDQEVIAGIKALSTYMALGQSGVGTWSHGMAEVSANGLYGPPSAYGAMNSASVVCATSLLLAQKCGIDEEPINEAVDRSLKFYRWYVDKGSVPYGDHDPKIDHDNNGKNSMTAVFFNLAGEEEPARYFTRATVASYNTRESGHTGNFFSMTWGAPGAACGGEKAAQSFVQNTLWMTEFERQHDGDYRYQYQIPEDTKKYNNYSTAGVRLIQHCIPRKAIHMTGKDGCLPPLSAEEVENCVIAATYPNKVSGRTVQQLLEDLGSWSPVVREFAAEELGKRQDNVVEQLIAMLDSSKRYARYGACRGLYYAGRGSKEAVSALSQKIQDSEDLTMRYFAVHSLKARTGKNHNGLAKKDLIKAAEVLLKQAATYEPEKDPMRKLHRIIAQNLFFDGRTEDYKGYFAHGSGLEKVNRSLLIPTLKSMLINPNGGTRSDAATVFEHLTEQELEQIYPDIYLASKSKAPSGVMFSGYGRMQSITMLAKNNFKESLPLALDLFYDKGWGRFRRLPAALNALSFFGSNLEPYIEDIQKEYEPYVEARSARGKSVGNAKKAWQKVQDKLDQEVELQSIRPYLEASGIDPALFE